VEVSYLKIYFYIFVSKLEQIEILHMKKVLAIAFIGSLFAMSCSKKADKSLQDSNTMLEEPAAPTVTDSTAKTDSTPVAIPAPSPSTDSTATR